MTIKWSGTIYDVRDSQWKRVEGVTTNSSQNFDLGFNTSMERIKLTDTPKQMVVEARSDVNVTLSPKGRTLHAEVLEEGGAVMGELTARWYPTRKFTKES